MKSQKLNNKQSEAEVRHEEVACVSFCQRPHCQCILPPAKTKPRKFCPGGSCKSTHDQASEAGHRLLVTMLQLQPECNTPQSRSEFDKPWKQFSKCIECGTKFEQSSRSPLMVRLTSKVLPPKRLGSLPTQT